MVVVMGVMNSLLGDTEIGLASLRRIIPLGGLEFGKENWRCCNTKQKILYSKICVKRTLKNRQNKNLNDKW